jgi:hypothetical protein
MAVGSDPVTYGIFVPHRRAPTVADLPVRRAARCKAEYEQVKAGFAELFLPHVDVDLLRQVQALQWLKDD